MKIYNELESLGFFEWLKEKGFGSGFTPIILDNQSFDSIERSGYNAIAFRWISEKYSIETWVQPFLSPEPRQFNAMYWYGGRTSRDGDSIGLFRTYEEAELKCLKKLIEICGTQEK